MHGGWLHRRLSESATDHFLPMHLQQQNKSTGKTNDTVYTTTCKAYTGLAWI